MTVRVDDPRDIQGAYDDLPTTANQLRSAETRSDDSYVDAGLDQLEAYANDPANHVREREEAPSSDAGWTVNCVAQENKRSSFKDNVIKAAKKGGPTGGVIGVIIAAVIGLFGISMPASLPIALKEMLVANLDQQNYTAEIRSRKILAKRFSGEATVNCNLSTFACRYKKPSAYALQNFSDAGIKAVDSSGNVIENQRLIGGERPAYYEIPGGKKIAAKDFKAELENNPEFRTAVRRAYNPRYINWADDVAMKFLAALGVSKATQRTFSDAPDADQADDALDALSKTDDVGQDAITEMVEKETDEFASKAAKDMATKSHGDTILLSAQAACVTAKAPGVITKVVASVRLLQLTRRLFVFLNFADRLKASSSIKTDAVTPQELSNVGDLLTRLVTPEGSSKAMSAMDSGAVKYGMLGDVGSAQNSKTLSKYIPGQTSGALGTMTQISNNQDIKKVCSAVGSIEAQAAVDALKAAKATNPAGWISLIGDVALFALEKTGALEPILGSIVGGSMKLFNKIVDWQKLLELFVGDFTKGVEGEELGDIIGIGAAVSFANLASHGGNVPLRPAQKVTFTQEITNPVKLAWAEEERLTHSPLDISSPYTALGSIAIQTVPYWSQFSSPLASLGAIASISTSTFKNLLTPQTSALNVSENLCTQDYLIRNSDVAAGPLCDVQYGIPVEYLDLEPDEVANELSNLALIDDNGEPLPGKELDDWIKTCTAGDSTVLDSCAINEGDRTHALYALYVIDKRIITGQDNPIQTNPPAADNDTSGDSTTIVDKPDKNGWSSPIDNGGSMSLKWHEMGSKGLHKGVDFPASKGTNVTSAHDGVVTTIRDMGSCGWATVIKADGVNGIWAGYQHMDPLSSLKTGDTVKRGQLIGHVGRFCGSGTHLHFSIETANRVSAYADSGANDTSLNPLDWIPVP